jgi:hypothetical protein
MGAALNTRPSGHLRPVQTVSRHRCMPLALVGRV